MERPPRWDQIQEDDRADPGRTRRQQVVGRYRGATAALPRVQLGQLVPELPAIENVMLPLPLLAGRRRAQARSEAAGLLGRLELHGLEQRRPGELSGGQAQRVAVARALVAGRR
jgi:ABC-type polar amino acid transport system ATPase subunit